MAHAWLDSLSEDWVSQPRSENSQNQITPFSDPPTNLKHDSPSEPISRIPRLSQVAQPRKSQSTNPDSSRVLSERSLNDVNIQSSQRGPSKLSREFKTSYRGRQLSRSLSASTAGSVLHNTVQHKSLSASPSKGRNSIPEWKRRLLYGEVAYGEAKDLFSSAGTGLENIFRPPPPDLPTQEEVDEDEGQATYDVTFPSSPPPYLRSGRRNHLLDESVEESSNAFSEIHPNRSWAKIRDDSYEDSNGPEQPLGEYARQELDQHSVASLPTKGGSSLFRKISGKSDGRHEDFSPILVTRYSNEDGRVSFTPTELPADQLRERLDKLRLDQNLLDSNMEGRRVLGPTNPISDPRNPDETEDFGSLGDFVNMQRGGRSAEDSFRHRLLSPPLETDTSEMLPESSLQASTPKQFPTLRDDRFASAEIRLEPATPPSPNVLRVPYPSPEKNALPHHSHAVSPLKLFGPYDTFTNQTLLRRISQFEDPATESPCRSVTSSIQNKEPGNPSVSAPHAPSDLASSTLPKVQKASLGHHETFGAFNRFGSGELNDYIFDEGMSFNSAEYSSLTDQENIAPNDRSMLSSHDSVASDRDSFEIRRRKTRSNIKLNSLKHTRAHSRSQSSPTSDSVARSHNDVMATPQREGSEGKRPRTSPSKDPTPKRRRTLHRSDIAYGLEQWPGLVDQVQHSHSQMQSGIGSQKIDLQRRESQRSDAIGIEMRQALQPHTPPPGQQSSTQRGKHPLAELHFSDEIAPAVVEGHPDIVIQDFAVDNSRKTSMRTQDFFEEAEKIMAMIRNKARHSGLVSVEESEAEGARQSSTSTPVEEDDSFQDSFKEPFLRPPSREGRPVCRPPARQEDPELADRLRMYEEGSEMGDLITYSMRSMGLAKEAIQEVNEINESIQDSIRLSEMRHSSSRDDAVVSDMLNVRITQNPNASTGEDFAVFSSYGSHASSTSTGRSIPTGSSTASDSRRLIAPDVVSELIGDQVGNMVLDKTNNIWTKVKASKQVSRDVNILPSEDSEDDPFASIPDLSVDTIKEKQNLRLRTGPLEDLQEYVKEDFPHPPSSGKKSPATERFLDDRSIINHTTEALIKLKQTVAGSMEEVDDIEHEITIHEDRVHNASHSRRRNLTITFSSPIASIIHDVLPTNSDGDCDGETSEAERSIGDLAAGSLRRGRPFAAKRSYPTQSQSRSRSRSKSAARNLSVRGQNFVPRPVSRIDEQDEDTAADESIADRHQLSLRQESSIITPGEEQEDEQHHRNVSIVITTPAPSRTLPYGAATPIISQQIGTLSLSPLSDFTMNVADQSNALEVSYVVGDNYLVTGDGSKRIMSQAIRNLVEKITEVEPFEPDWDAMQALSIDNKNLRSLHKLDEFCGNIATLDASHNHISHLDGVPERVRNLKMTHNQLSELTAWGHLMNLQYVDISSNEINSLYAFKDLVHLRNLRADNNRITSLDGIKLHDSLQVLRVRGNLIENIDLEGTKLQRLVELDLEGNQITSVRNLEQLPCLGTLNLEGNRLTSVMSTSGEAMTMLRYLKLSKNVLTELDLAKFPNLRLLHADRNCLVNIKGISRVRRLDSLSLREQKGEAPLDVSFLSSAHEVRKLFLSGNLLTTFEPKVDFLNLQYLEIANCGLESLSPNLGELMPNLRTLNLNFNAISDLTPLRYIPRLKKLLAAGNRLADPRALSALLAGFPHLAKLDLRDNPATLGFYPPLQTLVSAQRPDATEFDPFVLPDAGTERDGEFQSRLDVGTKPRRRLYELALTQTCQRLKMLDGLVVDRQAIRRKDAVWSRLIDRGLICEPDSEGKKEEEEDEGREAPRGSADLNGSSAD